MPQKAKSDYKYCMGCQKSKTLPNFYNTNASKFNPDGKVPLCKTCIKEMVDASDVSTVLRILRQIDKPFIPELWENALRSKSNSFGDYLRQINSLPQYRDMTWEDGLQEHDVRMVFPSDSSLDNGHEEYGLTPEIRRKWGAGYSDEEIYKMEMLWQDMMDSYEIETAAHRDYLKKICMNSVIIERLNANGEFDKAAKVQKSYDDLMKSSKFTAVQRTAADKTGGLNTFSEIFEFIEKEGFIPQFPDLDNDQADKTLDNIMTFTRRLVLGDPNLGTLVEAQIQKMQRGEDELPSMDATDEELEQDFEFIDEDADEDDEE